MIDPTELFPEIPNIYDFPSVHAGMLYDNERVNKYYKAIKKIIKPGDIVADIGTGTGLLAFLCLKAGAKKVHAIERTSSIEWAKQIADKNGLGDKIKFYNANSLDCDLDEKVDVVISELIGHIAFEEGMAESLFDAKERFLSPNGIMIPEKVELKVALVEESQIYLDFVDCWEDIEGIDFSVMRHEAVKACYLTNFKNSNLLSKPTTFIKVNFEDKNQLLLKNEKIIKTFRKGIIHGVALWFEAKLCPDIFLSSGPFNDAQTHWQQCFAPLAEPLIVDQDDQFLVSINIQLRTKEKNSFKFEFGIKNTKMPRKKAKTTNSIQTKGRTSEKNKECNIVILFADVVGCSEISNHKTLNEYYDFIKSFQSCFNEVCEHYRIKEEIDLINFDFESRGDEGCLKINSTEAKLAEDIDLALSIALDLKRKWLLSEENRKRISSGLLPIDIAIGIHAGKAWIVRGKNDEYKPEGYAINLTKRIESASRIGEFSHILISEAAYNHVIRLKDEKTYRFREPFKIEPKGISQNIKVFELKHHFLPTDWQNNPEEASIIYDNITDEEISIVKKAYESNPMNLWLAEELILLNLMNLYSKLNKNETQEELKAKYKEVTSITQQVANSDLRDAGILSLWGFVYGEQGNYSEEQKMYKAGLVIDPLDGLLHWYYALAMSYVLYDKMEYEGIDFSAEPEELDIKKIEKFYIKNEETILKIFEQFDRAIEYEPMNPWIIYDFACEKSWWSLGVNDMEKRKEYKKFAIQHLIYATGFNNAVKERAIKEDYLKPIKKEDKVKRILNS